MRADEMIGIGTEAQGSGSALRDPNSRGNDLLAGPQKSASFMEMLKVAVCATIWIVIALVGSVSASHSQHLKVHAVIVGIVRYQDPEIPPLKLSEKDATDFYTFLKEREKLFDSMHLTLLLNEKATRANITEALRNKLKLANENDVVIIYLSGHGAVDAEMTNEFYYVTYDARRKNLFGTALLMNDKNLFKGIASQRCLLLTDACHSGGFNLGLEKGLGTGKSAALAPTLFQGVRGRVGIASSRPDERSYERPVYGNSVFTHFLLKGLRGEAVAGAGSGVVSIKSLFNYVATATSRATDGHQNPQLYNAQGGNIDAAIFRVPTYGNSLRIKVQFQYEDGAKRVRPLTDGSVLRSGQRIGVTFRPESDCFVYILWKDSSGRMGRLFPNPRLTHGTGRVTAGETYWLPTQDGERWYVLDDNPGEEALYFVATRERNAKLEKLCDLMRGTQNGANSDRQVPDATGALEREISLMGFADRTGLRGSAQTSSSSRKNLFAAMDDSIRVSGAEAIYMIKFKHMNR